MDHHGNRTSVARPISSRAEDSRRRSLVDLHVVRIVLVVAVALNPRRNVVALSNGVGGIILVAIDHLCSVVVLHPVALTARIILDVDPLIVWIDTAHSPVDLSRLTLRLYTAAAEHAAKDATQPAVARADREKRSAHGENS